MAGQSRWPLFATSYFVASSTVTLVVSGFRGVYRPAFARVLAAGEHAQLQRAFDLMNKVQVLFVVPAGFGLWVMVADYLPLLYGRPFAAAVPVARVLVALLFAETALAVAVLVLWVDERYRAVLGAQFADDRRSSVVRLGRRPVRAGPGGLRARWEPAGGIAHRVRGSAAGI